MERRSFIEMFLVGTVGLGCTPHKDFLKKDGIDWAQIKKEFPDAKSNLLNLNNGSAGMMSQQVENELVKFISEINRHPPYEKAIFWERLIEQSKSILAEMISAEPDEIALLLNTTEAMNYVLTGIDIPEGRNVVCAHHDYTHAIDTLGKLSKEKNFKLELIDVDMPASDAELIEAYRNKITAETELVLITAMTHREGQILPVKEISALAHAKGAKVLVDAAHAIGQFEHSVKDWDCDFYATSLHKWLGGPLGSGMLFIKKDMLESVRGSYSAPSRLEGTMTKFEAVGTKSFTSQAAVLSALRFHQKIGTKNKFERLKQLTDYWVERVEDIKNIETLVPEHYGGMATFTYKGSSRLVMEFMKSKEIHIKKTRAENSNRTIYRVSPNIYHDFADLDRFVEALQEFSKKI